jgi:hypothetical protein
MLVQARRLQKSAPAATTINPSVPGSGIVAMSTKSLPVPPVYWIV